MSERQCIRRWGSRPGRAPRGYRTQGILERTSNTPYSRYSVGGAGLIINLLVPFTWFKVGLGTRLVHACIAMSYVCLHLRTLLSVPGELSCCRNVLRASGIPVGGGMRGAPCIWLSHCVQTWRQPPSLSHAGLDCGTASYCYGRTVTGAVSLSAKRRHMYTPPDSQSNRFEKVHCL